MRYAGWAAVTTMCACGRIGFDTPSAKLVVEDGVEAPSLDTMPVFDTTGTDYRGVPTSPGCRQH